MQFSFEGATQHSLRAGLIKAVYALSVVPVVLLTLLLQHGTTLRVPYLVFCLSLLAVDLAYVGIKMATVGHSPLSLSPLVITALTVVTICMIGLVQLSDGGPDAVYLDLFIVAAVFLGVVGDLSMRVTGLVVTVPVVAISGWGVGLRGWSFATMVIMMAAVCAAATTMTANSINDLMQIMLSRVYVDKLTVFGTGAETIEDGLSACLPMVNEILPAERVVAFLDGEGSGTFTPVVAWPELADADAALTGLGGFAEASSSGHSVIQAGHCFIPIGKTPSGDLSVVVVRRPGNVRSLAYVNEITNALAGSLLRMSGRVAFVEELRRESRIDPLTGLPNRRMLWERLELELERSRRTGAPLCVAMVDLDHFKGYNDEFGHLDGDEMLRKVSATMADACRRQDLLVRFGGEEFCFVLTDTALDAAAAAMEGVRGLEYRVRNRPALTISIGVVERAGADDATALLGRADQALYAAKQAGRNRVVAAGDPIAGDGRTWPQPGEGPSR